MVRKGLFFLSSSLLGSWESESSWKFPNHSPFCRRCACDSAPRWLGLTEEAPQSRCSTKACQAWRQRAGPGDLVGEGWALGGGNRQARWLRSGFNLGWGGGARPRERSGVPEHSTPHLLGWVLQIGSRHTPWGHAPTCMWGWGSRWGPAIVNQGSRRSRPSLGRWQSGRHSSVEIHSHPTMKAKKMLEAPLCGFVGPIEVTAALRSSLSLEGKGPPAPLRGAVLNQMTGPELAGDLPGMVSELFHESISTKFYLAPNETWHAFGQDQNRVEGSNSQAIGSLWSGCSGWSMSLLLIINFLNTNGGTKTHMHTFLQCPQIKTLYSMNSGNQSFLPEG